MPAGERLYPRGRSAWLPDGAGPLLVVGLVGGESAGPSALTAALAELGLGAPPERAAAPAEVRMHVDHAHRRDACHEMEGSSASAELLATFRAAAARRGAYAEQAAAAAAVVDDAVARSSVDALQLVQPELQRLLVNASCRLSQRNPAIRPHRDTFSALNSRVNKALKALGASGANSASPRKSRGVPAGGDGGDENGAAAMICPLAAHGPRHVCQRYCYFRAYAPHRTLHIGHAERLEEAKLAQRRLRVSARRNHVRR